MTLFVDVRMIVWSMSWYCVVPLCILIAIHWGLGGPGKFTSPLLEFPLIMFSSCRHQGRMGSRSRLFSLPNTTHIFRNCYRLFHMCGLRRAHHGKLEVTPETGPFSTGGTFV